MNSWTRTDLLATGLAVLLTLGMLTHRAYQHFFFESAAAQVVSNIQEVARAVELFHSNTGYWFPYRDSKRERIRVYLDPFHESSPDYQGLDEEWLWRENNFGMVLQLVQYKEQSDSMMTNYLFEQPFKDGEPYLRVLLDQGLESRVELEILDRAQRQLPPGSLAVLDDSYFIIDLRQLIDGR